MGLKRGYVPIQVEVRIRGFMGEERNNQNQVNKHFVLIDGEERVIVNHLCDKERNLGGLCLLLSYVYKSLRSVSYLCHLRKDVSL